MVLHHNYFKFAAVTLFGGSALACNRLCVLQYSCCSLPVYAIT